MAHAFPLVVYSSRYSGGFDGGVICFRVYLEQLALALKLTKPALQLLVVPCPQTHQATSHESLAGAAQSTPTTRP